MSATDDTMLRRATEIATAERARLLERTAESRKLYERAVRHMPLGVGSSFQAGDPYPIYVEQGMGARLWDVCLLYTSPSPRDS